MLLSEVIKIEGGLDFTSVSGLAGFMQEHGFIPVKHGKGKKGTKALLEATDIASRMGWLVNERPTETSVSENESSASIEYSDSEAIIDAITSRIGKQLDNFGSRLSALETGSKPTKPTGKPTKPTGKPTKPTGKPTKPTGKPTVAEFELIEFDDGGRAIKIQTGSGKELWLGASVARSISSNRSAFDDAVRKVIEAAAAKHAAKQPDAKAGHQQVNDDNNRKEQVLSLMRNTGMTFEQASEQLG